jgi:hypothetical protein
MLASHNNVKHSNHRRSPGRLPRFLESLLAVYALLLLLLPGGDCVATVSCGYGHTCALMISGGAVRCWGLNGSFVLLFASFASVGRARPKVLYLLWIVLFYCYPHYRCVLALGSI